LHGADIMPRPAALLEEATWYEGDLNLAAPISDASFDLICAIEVIEHLENPRHTIREIARMLRKRGCAVMTTPNIESIKSLLTFAARGHHAQFDDSNYPAHITALSSIDMGRMAQEAGLICERIFYTDHGTVPKLIHYHWQKIPLVGRVARGRRFSDNFGVVLRKLD
jgi:2-polyprenyl-3-methyl-5-hydroxy-6-metoxy-1,4-benzoquinol methylase